MLSRYSLQKTIGEGAQARIFHAIDTLTGEKCVLKVGDSVRQEALLIRSLNHPYTLIPFDCGSLPELGAYAAFPRLMHRPMFDCTRDNPDTLRDVARWIAEFLAFMHHRGWLYNDFKPEHFWVGPGELKTIDFGLCSRLGEKGSTYSGTFPHISPERLTGQQADERSDLFALGMLLLHSFYADEPWTDAPSLQALHSLQDRIKTLPPFWRDLISQLTAFEPSQRISSAEELWRKLLPRSARNATLLLPLESPFRVPQSDLGDQGVHVYESPSDITLSSVETQWLLNAWENNRSAYSIDLRRTPLLSFSVAISKILTEKSAGDFFVAVNSLESATSSPGSLMMAHVPPEMNSTELSYLGYLLSTLTGKGFKCVLLSSRSLKAVAEESWKHTVVAPMSGEERERLMDSFYPSQGMEGGITGLKNRDFSYPENLVIEVQKIQPAESHGSWAYPLRKVTQSIPFEQLTSQERRVLGFLAVAGGELTEEEVSKVDRKSVQSVRLLLERLCWKGFVRQQQGRFSATLPASVIRKRFRKEQLKEMGEQVLPLLGDDPARYYSAAIITGRQRSAAGAAIRAARSSFRSGQLDQSMGWYWKAVASNALLPKSVLVRLTRFYLRRADMPRARKLLKRWKKQYGFSFQWADQVLHYHHRDNRFDRAILVAKRVVARVQKIENPRSADYFAVRLAGFFVLAGKFDEAEEILEPILKWRTSLKPAVQGLLDHYTGLFSFYRGNLEEALTQTRLALRNHHVFRTTSLMNLGVIYGRMGKLEKAERCIQKAIRSFSKQQDPDRLCYAFNNMGLVLKEKRQLKSAREWYQRSIHLSRATNNGANLANSLDNVGTTYSLEGRTSLAIWHYRKAVSIARKMGLTAYLSNPLNNIGFQYAIIGQFSKAIKFLGESIKIRKKLKMTSNLGYSFESLGLTYLFAKRYTSASKYLNLSRDLFRACSAQLDVQRAGLYLALVACRQNRLKAVERVTKSKHDFSESSFEYGLYHYVKARSLLGQNSSECRNAIHEAERTFRRLPSLLWLAAVFELKAEFLFGIDHGERAALALRSSSDIYLRLGARKALFGLFKGESKMDITTNVLDKMMERLPFKVLLMIKGVLEEKVPGRMIQKILSTAIEFTDMERAVLVLTGEPLRIFRSVSLDDDAIKDICEISLSAIGSATETRKPFVCLNAANDLSMKNRKSIIANQILSIVCLPLWSEENLLGYIYLDSREGVENLARTESVLLEIFASIIALSLDTSLLLERSLEENEGFRASLGLMNNFPEIVGSSKAMIDVLKMIHPLMSHDLPVLITGQTGTGKELIARVLHFCGKRKNGPFVAINCSALSETLLESEIFGHEKGAFTGATEMRKGLFEQANNGTLFLDEIGDMPKSMQAKFLRVLQEGEYRRVGGNATLHSNVRVVLATNQDVAEMVRKKEFREDLYYRIRGVQIPLPSLSERRDDIPLLAAFFLKSAMSVARKKIRGFSPEVMTVFKRYSWPGNVRQLKIEIERIVAFIDHDWVQIADLDPLIQADSSRENPVFAGEVTLREMEKAFILQRLETEKWNIFHTARSLGLTRNGLYGKMKQYNISKKPAVM